MANTGDVVILLSALAVVAAAVLLVVGLIGGSVATIQAAIALAVVSMLLLWAARWIGSTVAPAGSTEPAPLPEPHSSSITYEPPTMDAGAVVDVDHELEDDWIDLT